MDNFETLSSILIPGEKNNKSSEGPRFLSVLCLTCGPPQGTRPAGLSTRKVKLRKLRKTCWLLMY